MGTNPVKMIRLQPFPLLHEQHTRSYRIWSSAQISHSDLILRYRIEAAHPKEFAKVVLPALTADPARLPDLWKTTCLECFVPSSGSNAYLELNFSPDGSWNAYAFKDYREQMTEYQVKAESIPKQIVSMRSDHDLVSEWVVPLTGLRQGMMSVRQNELKFDSIGLSAVLSTSVATTYWSLRHEGIKPDFHLRSGFSYPV